MMLSSSVFLLIFCLVLSIVERCIEVSNCTYEFVYFFFSVLSVLLLIFCSSVVLCILHLGLLNLLGGLTLLSLHNGTETIKKLGRGRASLVVPGGVESRLPMCLAGRIGRV